MHKIIFEKRVQNFFARLDKNFQERIAKKIDELSENPHLGKALVGNLSGLWRLRIGDYGIIYKIINEQLIILVLDMGHRRNIY